MSVTDGEGAASQDGKAYVLQIYPRLSLATAPCCTLRVPKDATAASVVRDAAAALALDASRRYVLAEVKECGGEEWVLEASDLPVQRVLLWPRKAQDRHPQSEGYYFLLQERDRDGSILYVHLPAARPEEEAQRLLARGFLPPRQEECADLCNLPRLTEAAILDNLRNRFRKEKIYTYAGSILIAINPFKFLPIYNPKYVKMYENHQLGKLEPHIFAIADVAYYTMLRKRVNQCIVISGESGSGKTQSTNFLIHCLTALSQKGYASGVERTILGAGPVLEAFGNAKTAHNNNSSRFGKFIQVNYLESGVVRGAVVEKYLLEKSRLVSREKNERNYHVFYYLLLGASEEEREEFKLLQPEDYLYLKQQNFKIEDEEDLQHDFERLQQAMEMVGFLPSTKKQIFSVLSAILYLGNVTYRRKSTGRDEGLDVGPPEVLSTLSELLKVKEELLVEALTKRKTVTANDKLILPYSHSEAITARDSMAKSLYSALFDWIVLRINHALLNKKDMEESVTCLSIGVLDIFGFEDFENNSFEQFCINYANEQLQYYFNQHIFKLEQEEYKAEGISWHNIEYTDNVGCIHLISKKPTGLFYLLDEESNFPRATDKTLLAKFKQQHQSNGFFVPTPVMEPAFVIRHFAGTVKYQIKDFREKNTDYMRPDIVALLRSSDRAYVRELIGMCPVAMFRWGILRATIRSIAAFCEAGRRWAAKTAGVVRRGSRTPLGELQRSNTAVEKMYRRGSLLDFSFDHSEELPLEAFEDIFASYENKKEMHAQIINSIKGLQWDGEDPRTLLQSWGRLRYPRHVLQKSKSTRQKQIIPKSLIDSRSLKFIVSLTLHDRTTKSLLHLHKKKKPPSISAQFQTSLSKLMETLGRAEPFFIRCIRSNAEKMEMQFDEALVLQQLRYTGMLETVRIRRSGYSAKYTFQEFIEQFRVLLPKSASPAQEDLAALFKKMGWADTHYQIGKTKVFMQEAERQELQDTLHKEVMRKIVFLQRWFRARLERMQFLRMRQAAVTIQRAWRAYQLQVRCRAATIIQAVWRGSRQRQAYWRQRQGIRRLQAVVRGYSARRRCQSLREEKSKREEEARAKAEEEARAKAEEEAAEEARRQARKAQQEAEEQQRLEERERQRRGEKPDSEMEGGEEHIPGAGSAEKAKPPEPAAKPEEEKRPPHRTSSSQEKRELRRQRAMEHSQRELKRAASGSSAADERPAPEPPKARGQEEPAGAEGKERADSRELDQYTFVEWKVKEQPARKEGRGSPGPARPSSLPLDGPQPERNGHREPGSPTSTLQRYSKQAELRDKGEKWREKIRGEGGHQDTSSPEDKRKNSLQSRGMSISLDNVSKCGSSGSDSPSGASSKTEVRVRYHKRRLAFVRSQLMFKSAEVEDIEYWTFPLPPISPGVPLTPMRPKPPVQSAAETTPDGIQASTLKRRRVDSPGLQEAAHALQPHPVTPEPKSGFLSKILRKHGDRRPQRDPQTPDEGEPTTPQSLEAHVALKIPEATAHIPPPASGSQHPNPAGTQAKRKGTIKISRATRVSEQWNASLDRQISNANELRHLDEFLGNQVNELRSKGKQLSGTELIFITATTEFRKFIKSMYSLQKLQMGYKGLMNHYKMVVHTQATEKQKESEVHLVVNLFQSVLDGFIRGEMKREEGEQAKPAKAQKKKRRKKDKFENYMDHIFNTYQVNIMQSCDQCNSFIWGMEKAYMCTMCKMVCHKKCISKLQTSCSFYCAKKSEEESGSHFGVRVCALTSSKNPVPVVLSILLEHVEMNGLYTEGIYRKSGSANRMKELHQLLESDPNTVVLDNYPIHAVTGLVKQWLRELPDPLMTFEHYSDFLRAVELPEKQEQIQAIYKVLDQLPPANYNTLERLIFHLVTVAKHEQSNRMSPNALAIVFAPCILRCPDSADPFTSMKDVAKTTTCVELILNEQIRKYNEKMEEIEHLEEAEALAQRQLKLKRQNTHWLVPLRFSSTYRGAVVNEKRSSDLGVVPENQPTDSDVEAEMTLMARIRSIKQEKEEITYRLPDLEQPGSDQENMDSEASVSSESLLDDRPVNSDTEGMAKRLKNLRASCPPQPADRPPLPLRVCSDSSLLRAAAHSPPPPAHTFRLHRRTPVLPTGNVRLPPGVAAQGIAPPLRNVRTLQLVKRREQPARRKDSIQSLYVLPGAEPFPSGPAPCGRDPAPMSRDSASTAHRRFSNPDISYIDGEA
ncbi:unconventional myosin-IXb isoform X2 [Lepisosteus oculatus]|uniref:unconventional myosin-IXb isoform X2 n=1 Tax=Lepisosteus oculatus TaxID=7918 RepID=UPI0037100574